MNTSLKKVNIKKNNSFSPLGSLVDITYNTKNTVNMALRRVARILPRNRLIVAQQRLFHKSLPAQSELIKKDDVGEMLGKAHGNVEFVVSKVDDLVNWARKGYGRNLSTHVCSIDIFIF